jgi:hypothetical protein
MLAIFSKSNFTKLLCNKLECLSTPNQTLSMLTQGGSIMVSGLWVGSLPHPKILVWAVN